MHLVLDRNSLVGVLGAGTMGAGIAQLAAQMGHKVVLFDESSDALVRAQTQFNKVFARLVEKGGLTSQEAEETKRRISMGQNLRAFAHCKLVVEAIVEDLEVKKESFNQIERIVSESCVLATNTSSLSVTALGTSCEHPSRVLGLHFFNPAPLMTLVELVPWLGTSEETVLAVQHLMQSWGKTVVRAKDTPGFIVNRVARPFYTESLRILEEGAADCATIDWALKQFGGFKMGPFELMDMIGNDINFKVTQSVFENFFFESRFRPALTQKKMVEAGYYGRKSGRGYFDYSLQARNPEPVKDEKLGAAIFERVRAMLINEAAEAVMGRVAQPADIDRAMTAGVNYPKGLLKWCDELGAKVVVDTLLKLHDEFRSERYRPCPLLIRMAAAGQKFFSE